MKGLVGGKSAAGKKTDKSDRRRLTVSHVEESSAKSHGRHVDDRGLIAFVKDTRALEAAGGGAARSGSFSVSSITSEMQESFEDKNIVIEGEEKINHATLKKMGVGIRCKKGLKPEAPNQDSFCFVHYAEDFDLFGVFDGHGICGHDVSNFCREALPKIFMADPRRSTDPQSAFKDAFAKTQLALVQQQEQGRIDSRTSGTTCTMVYTERGTGKLHVAYCGDSRAAAFFDKTGKPLSGEELTRDHKPNLPAERKRIEDSGGCVVFDGFYNHRVFKRGSVYPGLNMSRALGDCVGHNEAGIIATPDYKMVDLKSKGYVAFCLCSDGVWEFIEVPEAAKLINGCKDSAGRIDPMLAAETLAKNSWNRWMEDTDGEIADDITVIIKVFNSGF